jgi:hypothetical protein
MHGLEAGGGEAWDRPWHAAATVWPSYGNNGEWHDRLLLVNHGMPLPRCTCAVIVNRESYGE